MMEADFNDYLEDNTELIYKKLSDDAIIPKRSSKNAAGFDLFSTENKIIFPRSQNCVKTDIAIMVPRDTYARIAPRSGLTVKYSLDVGGGVIDADYRGNVKVILFNHSDKSFQVKKTDRIAQIIIEKICIPKLIEMKEIEETERGAFGFGSTGR